MKKIIKQIGLYLFAVMAGYFILTQVAPLTAHLYAARLPWPDSPGAQWAFLYFYLVRGAHVWAATSLAALVGFGMQHNRALRRITLTLPLWTATLYTQLYLLMMLK